MTTSINTNNAFFEVRFTCYAGSTQRSVFDKNALKQLGFNGLHIDVVNTLLSTDILPSDANNTFNAIRKAVQSFLSTKGVNHDLVGRLFNPSERIEIVEFMKEKQAEYEKAKEDFLAAYPLFCKQQLDKVQASALEKEIDPKPLMEAVKKKQPDIQYYAKKLEFRFLDLSVELDAAEWQEEIDRIKSDLKYKVSYETQQDIQTFKKNPSGDNPLSRVKKIVAIAARFKSLDFYISGLNDLSNDIQSYIDGIGGAKPARNYDAKEVMIINLILKKLENESKDLIVDKKAFSDVVSQEMAHIDAMYSVEEEVAEAAAPVAPKAIETKTGDNAIAPTLTSYEPGTQEQVSPEIIPKTNNTAALGSFSF